MLFRSFDKEQLSEEEYKQAQEISFRQLYGGVEEKYKNIDFFNKLDYYIENEWKKYIKFGATALPTGRLIKKTEGMNKLRVFNYIVQNMETKENLDRIEKINQLLEHKKTKLVLITYDSFLIDFCIEEGKDLLESIRQILQTDSMLTKYKYGKNYNL